MTPIEFADKYRSLEVFIVPFETAPDEVPAKGATGNAPAGEWKKTKVASYRRGEPSGGYRASFWSDIRKHVDNIGKEVFVRGCLARNGRKNYAAAGTMKFPDGVMRQVGQLQD